MNKLPNISQSLIKSLFEYKVGGECGLRFKAAYLDNVDLGSSDVQILGQWFEYKCTGALTRHGNIPEPELLKGGGLAAPYRKMEAQIANFHRIVKEYGIVIKKVGKKIVHDGMEGTVDIVAEWAGEWNKDNPNKTVYMDMKSTGLLNDKWNAMGWDFDTLPTKEKLMMQPVHYKALSIKEEGFEVPFFFLLFSNTNEIEAKIYQITLDETRIEEHYTTVRGARSFLKSEMGKGFTPYPDLKRCSDCVLKPNCEYAVEVPIIQTVYY